MKYFWATIAIAVAWFLIGKFRSSVDDNTANSNMIGAPKKKEMSRDIPFQIGHQEKVSAEIKENPSISNPSVSTSETLGEKHSVTANMATRTYTREEYSKAHPELTQEVIGGLFKNKEKIFEFESNFQGEEHIPFSSLTSDCPPLKDVQVPIEMRIDGNGSIVEAIPGVPDATISNEILKCKIQGGPAGPFTTTFIPDFLFRVQH